MKPLTYRDAGVDIDAGDESVRRIGPLARRPHRPEVLGGIGAFASVVRLPSGLVDPVLVSSADGVGTKLKLAFVADRHDTVGIDLVALGANDVLVRGAEPLYFLDDIGTSRVDPARIEAIVRGVAAGCQMAGCALVEGDTAELPDLYAPGEYDLAGFAVGLVERARLVDGDELLEPTRIYVKPVLDVLRRVDVHAMAHVTGGGITRNRPRVLPERRRAVVRQSAWKVPPVFRPPAPGAALRGGRRRGARGVNGADPARRNPCPR